MPTETNKSPLNLDPATIISLGLKQKKGQQQAVQDYAREVRQDLGIEEGQKGLFGGMLKSDEFKDLSFGKKLGMYGKGLFRSAVGGLEGVTGIDILPEAKEPEQPKYKTNIDPMTGEEIPFTMTGNMKPLKMLTGVKGNIPHNMSSKQYNDALKMSEISGANTLPSALTLKGDQYKIDANKDGEITGEDFKLLKK
tara:strand:- start:1019 stop:1603 length:585 start_codon:yes stop_codon:yes gene_type:complete